jgi:tetratricopeptide (TPR) repeat protein
VSTTSRLDELGKVALLLRGSRRLRDDDPEEMERLAELAFAATRLIRKSPEAMDAASEAAAEIANARRVRNRLSGAARMIRHALDLWRQGSRDVRLLARIAAYAAAVLCHLRRFPEALSLIEKEIELWEALGERGQAKKRRVVLALYTNYAGDPRRALAILCGVLPALDRGGDPELALAAAHNALWFMTELGWHSLAGRCLPLVRPLYQRDGRHLNLVRLRWLEARIEVATGSREEALAMFAEARDGFAEVDLPFPAAIVAIDLALVWAEEERFEEIETLARELYATFRSIGVPREGMAALLLVEEAARARKLATLRDSLRSAAALLPSLSLGLPHRPLRLPSLVP